MQNVLKRLEDIDDRLSDYIYRAPKKKQVVPVGPVTSLLDVYKDNAFAMPHWSFSMMKELDLNRICYYDKEDDLEHVKKVTIKRQPVNIAMNTSAHYVAPKFEAFLSNYTEPYADSGYTELYKKDTNQLPPNIAVLSKTMAFGYHPDKEQMTSSDLEALGNAPLTVNLLSVVGYGFDHITQPDFKYFKTLVKTPDLFWSTLTQCIQKVFHKILKCAKDHNMKYIHVAGFGLGAFSEKFDKLGKGIDKDEYVRIWRKELEKMKSQLANDVLVHGDMDFIFSRFESGDLDMYKTWKCIQTGNAKDLSGQTKKLIEEIIKRKIPLSQCLFINPWDPHSMVGNGNFGDYSMDGWYGRSTSAGIMSLPDDMLQFMGVKFQPYKYVSV